MCDRSVNRKYVSELKEYKSIMFSPADVINNICENSLYFIILLSNIIGLSSVEKVNPIVNYVSENYDRVVYILMTSQYNGSSLYANLIKELNDKSFDIAHIEIIDEEDNENDILQTISTNFVAAMRHMKEGGVIFNFLEKYSSNIYKMLYKLLSNKYNSQNSYVFSQDYVIVSFELNNYLKVPLKYRAGHIVQVAGDVIQSTKLDETWNSVFGSDVNPSENCVRGAIAFEIIYNVLSNTLDDNFDVVKKYLNNEIIETSVGELQMSNDGHFPVPIILVTSNEKDELNKVTDLSTFIPSYIMSIDDDESHNICDFTVNESGSDIKKPFYIIFMLSFDENLGSFDLFYTLVGSVDYINLNGGIQNKYVKPIIMDITIYSIEYIFKEMINTYKTRIAFGPDNSDKRVEAGNIAKTYGIIIFYPFNYEGSECFENIIYCGMPITSRIAYIPWMLSELGNKISILYTKTKLFKGMAKFLDAELKARSVIPVNEYGIDTNTNLNNILKLIKDNMDSGVIIAFLDGNSKLELFKDLNDENMKYPDYVVIAENLRKNDLRSEYGKYMENHYMWMTYNPREFTFENMKNIYTKEYVYKSQSSTGISNGFIAMELFYAAFSKIELNNNDDDIPYSFNDTLNILHKTSFVDNGNTIKIYTNNHINFYVSLNQIKYFKSSKVYATEELYTTTSQFSAPNPWETTIPSDIKYICEWDVNNNNRGEKIPAEKYDIGLIFSYKESSLQLSAMNLIISFFQFMNDKGGKLNKRIDFKIFDSSSNNLENAVAEALESSVDVFIGCESITCKKLFSDAFEGKEKYLFYPGSFEGQECDSNIFHTGAIPNQLIDSILSYFPLVTSYTDIIFIGTIDTVGNYSKIMETIIKASLSDNYRFVNSIYIEDIIGSVNTVIDTIISDLSNGGVVISTLQGDNLINLINLLQRKISTKGLIQILCYNTERDVFSTDNNDIIDIYVVNNYFDEENMESNFRTLAYQDSARTSFTSYEAACFCAVNVWDNAINKAGTFSVAEWKNLVYNLQISGPSGVQTMNNNQYLSQRVYVAKYTPGSSEYTIIYSQNAEISPMPWNWDISETFGYLCDLSQNKEFYTPNIFTIILGISTTGFMSGLDEGITEVVNMFIDEYNNNGGLIDYRLYLVNVDIRSDDTQCYNTISAEIKKYSNIHLIITSGGSNCLSMLKEYTITYDLPIIHIGITPGESCEENIIYANKDPSVLERLVNVLSNVTNEISYKYSILFSNDDASTATSSYMQKVIENQGGEVVSAATFNNNIDKDDIENILTTIKQRSPEGCFILLIGSKMIHEYVDQGITNLKLNTELFKVISYSTGYNMANTKTNPYYTIQSYLETNLTENKNFKDNLALYTSSSITETMSNTYSILKIISEGITKTKSIQYTKYKNELYSIEYNSPEGIINLDPSNYLSHFIRIGYKAKNTNKIEITYESTSIAKPKPWKIEMNDGYYICDFSSNSGGYRSKQPTVTIGVLASFTGYLSDADRLVYYGIKAAVNEINEDGGILGKRILLETRDPESEVSKYVEYGKEFGKLSIQSVFGGSRAAIQNNLVNVAEQYNYLYFYPGMTIAGFCSKNIFTFGITPYQMISPVRKYTLSTYDTLILIYSEDDLGRDFEKSMKNYCNYTSHIYYGYSQDNLTDFYNLSEDIKAKAVIVLGLLTDYLVGTITTLCENGILATKYTIICPTLDQLIMNSLSQKCRNNLAILASFTVDMGLETSDETTILSSAVDFVKKMHNEYGTSSFITQQMESGYTSVKVWAEAAKISASFDTDKLRNGLYGLTTSTPTGILTVSNNGFTKRVVFGMRINEDGTTRITNYSEEPENADAYNQLIPGNEGYICDFTSLGSKFNYDIIKVVFFHQLDNNSMNRENLLLIYEEYLVNDINNNLLNGYYVQPVFIFASDEEEFSNKLLSIENDPSIVLFLGCNGDPCKTIVLNEAKKLNIMFIYAGMSYAQFTDPNVLVSGSTIYQHIKGSFEYTNYYQFSYFYIILPNTDEYLFFKYKYS